MTRNAVFVALLGATTFAWPARADYLYDVVRAECLVEPDAYYSAADPVIGTVPIVESEFDRIAGNYLVYGGFRYHGPDDFRGHLYALRLFEEKTPHGNDWEFTDTGAANLFDTCGDDGSACLFDAGEMLAERVASATGKRRRILTGNVDPTKTVVGDTGAYTIRFEGTTPLGMLNGAANLASAWSEYTALAPIAAAMPRCATVEVGNGANRHLERHCACPDGTPETLCQASTLNLLYTPPLASPTLAQRQQMVEWLHAKNGRRSWPLGDVYHASAAVVEPPGFQYKDRGYPEFREKLARRPYMIYVGANDGMIHAFHATHDFEKLEAEETERWELGEEAWAYLPTSMLARTMIATEGGKQRFFSQDLSCRFTDVQVDTSFTTCTEDDQERDPYCGWRTVLLCGQGWGGSWYVALDVTEPLTPKPLWEFTHLGSGDNKYGMGRAWSLPSLSLVARNSRPVWLAIFGNGMNSSMIPYDDDDPVEPWYRNLNIPFKGMYSHQGQGTASDQGHAYVLNAANGALLAEKHDTETAPNPILADGTVLDFNDDGLVDAAFLASYKGMNRIDLSSSSTFGMCDLSGLDLGGQAILTGHPTAFAYKKTSAPYPVVLVAGSGIDSGSGPDEQANNGKAWGVLSKLFEERIGATCPTALDFCDLDFGFDDGSRKARLLGAPIFTRRPRTGDNTRPYDDLLLYTVWTAPHHNEPNQQCGNEEKGTGVAHLLCMDVTLQGTTLVPRCVSCTGFSTDEEDEDQTLLYSNRPQAPSSPVSADGVVFVTDPDSGLDRIEITNDGNPPNANSNRPSTAVPATLLSWREVYAE